MKSNSNGPEKGISLTRLALGALILLAVFALAVVLIFSEMRRSTSEQNAGQLRSESLWKLVVADTRDVTPDKVTTGRCLDTFSQSVTLEKSFSSSASAAELLSAYQSAAGPGWTFGNDAALQPPVDYQGVLAGSKEAANSRMSFSLSQSQGDSSRWNLELVGTFTCF